jgi:hypothetical protein
VGMLRKSVATIGWMRSSHPIRSQAAAPLRGMSSGCGGSKGF